MKKRMTNRITFRPDSSFCYGTEGVSLVVKQLNPLIVTLRHGQNPFRQEGAVHWCVYLQCAVYIFSDSSYYVTPLSARSRIFITDNVCNASKVMFSDVSVLLFSGKERRGEYRRGGVPCPGHYPEGGGRGTLSG